MPPHVALTDCEWRVMQIAVDDASEPRMGRDGGDRDGSDWQGSHMSLKKLILQTLLCCPFLFPAAGRSEGD